MAKAQTIDNLPVEYNIRYAHQIAEEEISPLISAQESRAVSQVAQSDIMSPFALNQYDILFSTNQRNLPWSMFEMPPGYDTQSRRIFLKGQVIPSLGTSEMLETSQRRIEAQINNIRTQGSAPSSLMNETIQGGNALNETIALIQELNFTSSTVEEKSNQYHKG